MILLHRASEYPGVGPEPQTGHVLEPGHPCGHGEEGHRSHHSLLIVVLISIYSIVDIKRMLLTFVNTIIHNLRRCVTIEKKRMG